MDQPEPKVQSFIVKLWLEEADEETGKAVWRGHITHVPGGQRRYLKSQSDLRDFIGPYLEDMSVKRGLAFRLRTWLGRRLIRWTKRP